MGVETHQAGPESVGHPGTRTMRGRVMVGEATEDRRRTAVTVAWSSAR